MTECGIREAPGLAQRRLTPCSGWLRPPGIVIAAGVLIVAGAMMVIDGICGLAAHG